jgi:LCP family protein required for cell wall assembly
MLLGLSITATWALRLLGVAAAIFFVVAVLPVLVLRKRPHRTWFQRSVLSLNVSLVVVALTSASVLTWFEEQLGELPRQDFGEGVLSETESKGEPQNFLLVGIDQAAGLDPTDPVNIGREAGSTLSDTVMVLRIVPETNEAALLSFPRDLYLPIAGTGGSDRINTALGVGGPETLIRTIEENFGIPIHHYVQVNFAGFKEIVRILGGVPMYFPDPVKDPNTGLYVVVPPEGACVTLDPDQALAFARSRNYHTYVDGYWEVDGTADLGRIQRQQLFIRLALAQAVDKGARNTSTMQQFLDVGKDHVLLDDELEVGDLLDIGNQFKDFDPEALKSYQLPVRGGNVGPASVVFLVEDEAQDELNVFRGVGGTIVLPEALRVNVRNGSGTTGQATDVAQALQAHTFSIASAADAESFDYPRTIIRYTPGNQILAAFLARYLDTDPVIEEVPSLGGATLELVTGRDFTGIRAEPRSEDDVAALVPQATTTSTSTTTTPPSTTTTTEPPTTTTTFGAVPEQPPGIEC